MCDPFIFVLPTTPPPWLQTQNILLLIVNRLVHSIFVPLVSSFRRCSKPTEHIYFHGDRCLSKPHLAKPSVQVCVQNVSLDALFAVMNGWITSVLVSDNDNSSLKLS